MSYVKVFSGWVHRTGLSDTVFVAGSYEVTPPWRTAGGVDRSLRERHRRWWVSRILGQNSPGSPCGPWQVLERLTGDAAFETPHDLASQQAFGPSPPDVVAGLVVARHAGQDDPVERSVGLPVPAVLQANPAISLSPQGVIASLRRIPVAGVSPTPCGRWSTQVKGLTSLTN